MKVEISNPGKIIFPKSKITKKQIIDYYSRIFPKMLPYIKDRPLALERCPDGLGSVCFYQKNAQDYFPKWIKTKKIKGTEYVICNDQATIKYLANLAVLVFHQWLSKVDKPDYPDLLVWDMDPPSIDKIEDAKQAALTLKKILDYLKLPSYLLSTGSKGFHIMVPIKRDYTFKETKAFSRRVSELIEKLNPEKFTTEQRIIKRKQRVFIDFLRNEKAQLKVVPYSLRAKEPGTVAMPLSWAELKAFRPGKYTIKNSLSRKNPWTPLRPVSLDAAMKRLDKLEREAGISPNDIFLI